MTKYSCGCESNCDDRNNPKMITICQHHSNNFPCERCGFPNLSLILCVVCKKNAVALHSLFVCSKECNDLFESIGVPA